MMVAETATLRVRLRGGEVAEHAINPPGFIVPGGTLSEADVESIAIIASSGEELFLYDVSYRGTGAPPPPPPSPGC